MMAESDDITNELAKIRWRTRRGMLELDIFLKGFFENNYLKLEKADQMRFVQLLTRPDPDIYAWLMGYESSECPDDQKICGLIRSYVEQLSVSN